jgi:hypothetical protein
VEITHHHLPDQLGQGTTKKEVVNAFSFAAEVTMCIPSPASPKHIIFGKNYFSASTKEKS